MNLASSDKIKSDIYLKVVKRFAPILFVSYLVSILDRVNIGYSKLQMSADIGISDASYAIGASVFFWGYIIFEVPSNMLLHRLGAKVWICRIMVSWGIVSGLIAFVVPISRLLNTSPESAFYILRFLLGVCEAGFFPGLILFINYWMPASRQSRILPAFLLGIPLSSLIGAPLSGVLMSSFHDVLGLAGWQWMLLIEALPAVFLGIALFFRLQDRPVASSWLTADEVKVIQADLAQEATSKVHSYSGALRDRRFWILMVVALFFSTGNYGLLFWMPSLIQSGGVTDPLMNGLLVGAAYGLGAVTMVINSWHSGLKNERRWHAAIPAAIAALGLIGSSALADNFYLAYLCLLLGVGGIMALIPIFWNLPGTVLSGAVAAGGIALINSSASLAGIAGSMISSWAKDVTGSLTSGNYVLGTLLLVASVLFLMLGNTSQAAE